MGEKKIQVTQPKEDETTKICARNITVFLQSGEASVVSNTSFGLAATACLSISEIITINN